jgi:beta-mannosidase
VPHLPAWKAGVPRDAGAGWDFEDVRDHYLHLLYEQDPLEVRWSDPARYLELGRAVTGEVMADTFGEWRRGGSACAGALVLWLRDLRPGAGWGLIDSAGAPKAALAHLRRAFAPVAVWITDEGLAGMSAQLANDTASPLSARLRVALYRDGEVLVEQAAREIALAPHGATALDLEEVLGRFLDIGWSYRFGPPGHDLVVASLEAGPEPGEGLISQAVRFPVGRPLRRQSAGAAGLEATASQTGQGTVRLALRARRVLHGVRIEAPGWVPDDDALTLEPGIERAVGLRAVTPDAGDEPPKLTVSALNLADSFRPGLAP